ncbi:hypothetical protein [Geoglobus acetivorans]|uniref:Multipass membrane protein n=1 Tax=Geoglobus acetivorans TaxID=565033 RepID=A0ABZ3H2Q3_GEOAI|nr:hypothetical protein [Geoglobus acetivorans]
MGRIIRKLLLLWITLISALIPLYINLNVLHYQTDPFISTTINMGKAIKSYGSLDITRNFYSDIVNSIHLTTPFWQKHTSYFVRFEPGSGIFLAIMSIISGIEVRTIAYLPVPFIVSILILFSMFCRIYEYTNRVNQNKKNIATIFNIVFLGSVMYSFISFNFIGKIHTLVYHGIYVVQYLTIYYILLRITFNEKKPEWIILIVLTFCAMIITHYRYPLMIAGGITLYVFIIYLTISIAGVQKFNISTLQTFLYLNIFMWVVISLNEVYFRSGAKVDILSAIVFLKDYLLRTFTLSYSPISSPETSGSKMGLMMSLLYTAIILIISMGSPIVLLLGTVKKKNMLSKLNVDYYIFYLYVILFGGSIVRFLSYSSIYLNFAKYGLTNPELIALFLVISTKIIRQKFKKVGTIMLAMLLVSSMLIFGKSLLYAYSISNPSSAYYYGPKEEGIGAFGFLVYHLPDSTSIIGGSIQVSSGLYEYLSYCPLEKSKEIIPAMVQVYIAPSPYTINGITTVYNLMNKELDYFIIANKEIHYGLNGGLMVYLDPDKTNKLYKLMSINEDRIYSGSATIYHFKS